MPSLIAAVVVGQPCTSRVDWFKIAPDHDNPVAVWHLQTPSPNGELPIWVSLGGGGSALSATWTQDGTVLELLLIGEDDRLWINTLAADSLVWSGWTDQGAGGRLNPQVV